MRVDLLPCKEKNAQFTKNHPSMQNSSSIGPHQGLLLALERTPLCIGLAKDPAGLGTIKLAYLQI